MTQLSPSYPFDGSFLTTRWTRVLLAKSDSEEGCRALSDLCEAYYEPVVVYLSCEFRDEDLAREAAHSFFAEILEGGRIAAADPGRGRFRSYLLGAVKHFLSRQRESMLRKKRGGGIEHVPLDQVSVENLAAAGMASPDLAFDRQWATTLLGHALTALEQEYGEKGRQSLFEKLKPWLTGDAGHGDQQVLAEALGMNVHTLRSEIRRMKQRFQALVQAGVNDTLHEGDSIREELDELFAALRSQ